MAAQVADSPVAQDTIDRLGKSIATQLAQLMSTKEQAKSRKRENDRQSRSRRRIPTNEGFQTPSVPRQTMASSLGTPASRYGTIAPPSGYASLWDLPDRDNTPYRPGHSDHERTAPSQPSTAWMTGFTEDEDELLMHMRRDQCCSWEDIQKAFPGKSRNMLIARWRKQLKYTAYRPDTTEADVRSGPGVRYSRQEDDLLIELKEVKKLPWKEITTHFPERSIYSLSYHYTAIKNKHSKMAQNELRTRKKDGSVDADGEPGSMPRRTGAELFAALRSNFTSERFERSSSVMTSRRRDELSATPEEADDGPSGATMIHYRPEDDYNLIVDPPIDPQLEQSHVLDDSEADSEDVEEEELPQMAPPTRNLIPRSRFQSQSHVHPLLHSMIRTHPAKAPIIDSSTTFGINRRPLHQLHDILPQARGASFDSCVPSPPHSDTVDASCGDDVPPPGALPKTALGAENASPASEHSDIDSRASVTSLQREETQIPQPSPGAAEFEIPPSVEITDIVFQNVESSGHNASDRTRYRSSRRPPRLIYKQSIDASTSTARDRPSSVKLEEIEDVATAMAHYNVETISEDSGVTSTSPVASFAEQPATDEEVVVPLVSGCLHSKVVDRSSPDPLVDHDFEHDASIRTKRSGSLSSMSSEGPSGLSSGKLSESKTRSTSRDLTSPTWTPLTSVSSCRSQRATSTVRSNYLSTQAVLLPTTNRKKQAPAGKLPLHSSSEIPTRRSVRQFRRDSSLAPRTPCIKNEVHSGNELAS